MDDFGHCLTCGHISCICDQREELSNADAINDAQENATASLRAKIQARKALYEDKLIDNAGLGFIAPKRELQELPDVVTPLGEFGEFSYERFIEVQKRLDIAYGNYLWWLKGTDFKLISENYENSLNGFESSLKELVRTVDLYITESLRVRY